MIARRKFLFGLAIAPAIIRIPGLLMPIKPSLSEAPVAPAINTAGATYIYDGKIWVVTQPAGVWLKHPDSSDEWVPFPSSEA